MNIVEQTNVMMTIKELTIVEQTMVNDLQGNDYTLHVLRWLHQI